MLKLVRGPMAMQKIRPIEWIWEPLIPKNCISVIASRGGIGKSGFALWLADTLSEQGRNVLYVDAENTGPHIKQRYEDWNIKLTNVFFTMTSCDDDFETTSGPKTLVELDKLIEDCKPDLVILDSLTVFARGLDINRRDVMAHYLEEITKMASRRGTGILILAHTNKRQSNDDGITLDSIAGSGAITDLARSVMIMDEFGVDGGRILTQYKLNLAAKSDPLVFTMTPVGIVDVRFFDESNRNSGTKAERLRNLALDLLQKGEDKKSVREILKSEGAAPAEYGRAIDWAASKLGIVWDKPVKSSTPGE